jgi:outer membrane protein TolC
MIFSINSCVLLILSSVLASCAQLTPNAHEAEVRAQANHRLGEPFEPAKDRQTERDTLLSQTLTLDNAVHLALINNPNIQSRFAELQLSETEIRLVARLRNPGISIAHLTRGNERELERAISLDVMGLLTLPLRGKIAKQHFESLKLETTAELLTLAHETRRAYHTAIAASQRVAYANNVQHAAQAGQQFANDLAKAGNISRLDAAREQAFYVESQAQYTRLMSLEQSAHEQLIQLLGLTDRHALKLPTQLDPLPAAPQSLDQVEQLALHNRIDVQLVKQQAAQTAQALQLTKVTRLVNVLDLGYQSNRSNEQPTQKGFEISLELPLFDFGSTRVAQAEAIYRRALADVASVAIAARSQARETYARYQRDYALAKHYRDQVLPLQQQISQEMLLRYNGMLISPFELLAQAREQISSSETYVSALENFWLAQADLDNVLQGNVIVNAANNAAPINLPIEGQQP